MSLLLSQKLDLGQSCNTIFLRSNKIHELWAIEFWLVLDNEKKERIVCSRLLKGLIPVFKNLGERSAAKDYCPVNLPSVVSMVFEKPVNNRLIDHLKNVAFFCFWYGFRFLNQLQIF